MKEGEASSDQKGEQEMQGSKETPFVELRHIDKSFPGVKVLEDISISFFPGQVHVLLGENGAGKSFGGLFMYGVFRPEFIGS